MIRIEVNCNDDKVEIYENANHRFPTITIPLEQPVKVLKMLEEIFNMLIDNNGKVIPFELTKVDEDSRTAIGEW